MDRVQLLKMLFAAFPNTGPTEATFLAYTAVLKDIPLPELEAVIIEVISQPGSFPPSAGDLRERWLSAKGKLPSTSAAEEGWEAVMKAIRYPGRYGSPKFDDPITERVVKAFGWLNFCDMPVDQHMAYRAQFVKFYNAYAHNDNESARMTPGFALMANRAVPPLLERDDDA